MSDNLQDRAKILEDLFFSQLDSQLLRQRRSDLEHEELVSQLQEHTNITDRESLEHLINLGVTLETYIAVQLIPLILVAWAGPIATQMTGRPAGHWLRL